MTGITIGTGNWKNLAEYSADRMSEMTDADVMVLGDDEANRHKVPHPAWLKCYINHYTNDHEVIVFDADLFCMREWNPCLFTDKCDMAVVKDEDSQPVYQECQLYDIGFGNYFNSGMMLFGDGVHVITGAINYLPSYGRWNEQTAINKVIWDRRMCPMYLPRAYNRLLWPGVDNYDPEALKDLGVVNLHFASIGNPDTILEIVRKL